ncbi:hypothetical protein, partial [Tianweitania sp.]|uniref:hypothetical protein n=1 Tax=Tianweitania sp. TaxID=2021634 RepID=UPI00289C2B51
MKALRFRDFGWHLKGRRGISRRVVARCWCRRLGLRSGLRAAFFLRSCCLSRALGFTPGGFGRSLRCPL